LLGYPAPAAPTIVRYGQPTRAAAGILGPGQPDVVVAGGLLDQLGVQDLQSVLAEIRTVARPGTRLYLDMTATDDPLAVGATLVGNVAGRSGWRIAAERTVGKHHILELQAVATDDAARIASLEAEVARLRGRLDGGDVTP
jgi:hypothetical protein